MSEQENQTSKPRLVVGRVGDTLAEQRKLAIDMYTALKGKEPTAEELAELDATLDERSSSEPDSTRQTE